MKNKKFIYISLILMIGVLIFGMILVYKDSNNETITTLSNTVSNKKICWGIKRNDDHEQPDVGSENKKILEQNNGICLGNKDKPYIYLTFDAGYEAGYMPQILKVLNDNDVNAVFFITAHYLNTQPELVQQMLEEGHLIGNHSPYLLMDS